MGSKKSRFLVLLIHAIIIIACFEQYVSPYEQVPGGIDVYDDKFREINGTLTRKFFMKHVLGPVPFSKYPGKYEIFEIQVPLKVNEDEVTVVNWDTHRRKVEPTRYDNQSFEWVRVIDGCAYPWGGAIINDTVYYHDMRHQNSFLFHWPKSGVFTEFRADVVFNYGHWGWQYGHWIIDFLPLVTMISPEMRKKAHILMQHQGKFGPILMNLFGFPKDHVHHMRRLQVFSSHHMYLTRPVMIQKMYVAMIRRMRLYFREKLSLDQKTPWRYVFYNRDNNRIIRNAGNIRRYIIRKYPQIDIDVYRDEERMNLGKSMRWADKLYFYNEMMFSMGMHGSGYLNVVFMQTNTVMLEIETGLSWTCIFTGLAKGLKIHLYTTRDITWRKHWQDGNILPVKALKFYDLLDMALTKALELEKGWKRLELEYPKFQVLQADGTFKLG